MDAVAHGVAQALDGEGWGLRLFPADLRGGRAVIAQRQEAAVTAALAAGMQAIVLFVVDVNAPASGAARALAQGIPVVAIHKPAYRVNATVVVPNYHHGVVLAQALARAVPSGARTAILGGPEILDDIEMVRGAVSGARDCGLQVVNDPFSSRYRNLDDLRGGGRTATENLLADFFPFDGLLVFNDETLLDVVEVLEGRGLIGRVPTVSRNGSPEAAALVAQGRSLATFDYHLPEIGLLAGRLVLRCLGQDPPPPEAMVSAPVGELYTRENIERHVSWRRRVRHSELVVA
jgi:ABC-type sugar transport system substrate-binding protein